MGLEIEGVGLQDFERFCALCLGESLYLGRQDSGSKEYQYEKATEISHNKIYLSDKTGGNNVVPTLTTALSGYQTSGAMFRHLLCNGP